MTDVGLESPAPVGERAERPATAEIRHWIVADPVPIGVAMFAFALALYGARFVTVKDATLVAGPLTVGLNYAVLVAAIGESVCGLLAVMRGVTYPGYVLGIFGIWLWGFYFLITAGAGDKDFTPDALAWYAFLLDIPVILMAVPAFVHRNIPFAIAFIALILLVFFLGLGYHDVYNAINTAKATKSPPSFSGSVSVLKISAWAGFVASAALFWVFAVDVYEATGVMRPRRKAA
jgi:hypothetical protein